MNIQAKWKRWSSAALLSATLAAAGAGCGDDIQVDRNGQNPNGSITSKGIDPQDFKIAAQNLTTQMLGNPQVQQAFQRVDPSSGKPLILISRFRNDSGLKINMVDYLARPVKNTLVNSGKAQAFSDDPAARSTGEAHDLLNGTSTAKPPDFILSGVVSRLSTSNSDRRQNYFFFEMTLVDGAGNEIWSDRQDVTKGYSRGGGLGL